MKPLPEQILHSIRYSLETVIIPQLDDRWARYEAKTIGKMLEHLELRWKHETTLLLEGSRDLADVFEKLAPQIEVLSGDHKGRPRLVDDMRSAANRADGLPKRIAGVEELTEDNDSLRALMVRVIESLDEIAETSDDSLAEIRDEIGRYLRREIDRDNQLAHPTHMSFAPPKPKKVAEPVKP